jgi:hypothetical protein
MGFPLQIVSDPKARSCGGCTACCTALGVVELKKKMWVRCDEECTSGCSIYDNRPQSCRDFTCLWLTGNIEGDERRRPDQLGLIFVGQGKKFKEIDIPVIGVWEIRPDALNINHYLIERLSSKLVLYCMLYNQPMKRRIFAPPHLADHVNRIVENVYLGDQ